MSAEMKELKAGTDSTSDEMRALAEETVMKLSKTYNFEGERISELDFSRMEDVTAEDMIKANKVLTNSGTIALMPENDLHYALIIAARVTGRPIEFLKTLSPKDAIRIKNKVTNFFFGEE